VARLIARFEQPEPRLALGRALAGIATAAIDISDGLLADLGHLCRASGCGACVTLADLPDSAALAAWPDGAARLTARLAGGDDYELLFCLPPAALDRLAALARAGGVPLAVIGRMTAEPGVVVVDAAGQRVEPLRRGFRHFVDSGPGA
jgi:thiamine-monophosphate kinase